MKIVIAILLGLVLAIQAPSRTTTIIRGPVVAAAGLTTIISDDFTGVDSTTLTGRSPNLVNTPSVQWTAGLGGAALFLTSNRATNSGVPESSRIDPGQANCTITTVVRRTSVAGEAIVVFRLSDGTNYWFVDIAAAGTWTLYKTESGSAVAQDSETGVMFDENTDYTITITLSGNSITASMTGAPDLTASNSFNSSATKLELYVATGTAAFDSIIVTTP